MTIERITEGLPADEGGAMSIHDAAREYVSQWRFSVIPISRAAKKPLCKWKEYQSRRPTEKEIANWPADCNVAIVTGTISGIVVVDCESRDDAVWFWNNRGRSPVIVKTKRGYHLYFSPPGQPIPNQQKVEQRYDVRGEGGYALAPPSVHSNGEYAFIKRLRPANDLPPFNPAWLAQRKATYQGREISNGASYIRRIAAISGKGGHNATYRAVCRLKDAGLSEAEALAALLQWNATNAQPPWSIGELLHKVRSVYGGPSCDHNTPEKWEHRDGKAFCPGCRKFMGRLQA